MWLLHGTTRTRAERLVQQGPDLQFIEPGGVNPAENFSFTLEGSVSAVGDAVMYARGTAAAFSNESGPAVLAVDVPEKLIRMAVIEHLSLFGEQICYDGQEDMSELVALCGGVIQFDPGLALDMLLASWDTLVKDIRGVQ